MKRLSPCATEVYQHDRDRFLQTLFVPEARREAFYALFALNVELAQIRGKISEELIGQVRFAWWQERIEELYDGHPTPGHPVLEGLIELMPYVSKEELVSLVQVYRDSFPELPQNIDSLLEPISTELLHGLCRPYEPDWRQAQSIIGRHRTRFGKGWNAWLSLKLLVGG